MYPASFEYFAPTTLDEALALLRSTVTKGESSPAGRA